MSGKWAVLEKVGRFFLPQLPPGGNFLQVFICCRLCFIFPTRPFWQINRITCCCINVWKPSACKGVGGSEASMGTESWHTSLCPMYMLRMSACWFANVLAYWNVIMILARQDLTHKLWLFSNFLGLKCCNSGLNPVRPHMVYFSHPAEWGQEMQSDIREIPLSSLPPLKAKGKKPGS